MDRGSGSQRATLLAARLEAAAASLIDVIAGIGPEPWRHVSARGVWAIGKDAEHVIEAAAYHEWLVRLTIGQPVSRRRPILERARLTSDLTPGQAVVQLRRRSEETGQLLGALTDGQLDLPTRPPRARSQALATTIERVLIGHYDVHRDQIEAKVRTFTGRWRDGPLRRD